MDLVADGDTISSMLAIHARVGEAATGVGDLLEEPPLGDQLEEELYEEREE